MIGNLKIFQFSNSIHDDGTFCFSDNQGSGMRKVSLLSLEKMILDLLESDPKILTFSNKDFHSTILFDKRKISTILPPNNREEEFLSLEELEARVDEMVEKFVLSSFGSYLCIILEN